MVNEIIFDYCIIGSGPSGAISALSLTKNESTVLMLDVGNYDNTYQDITPELDFESIRKSVVNQHKFFLGDKMEAIPNSATTVGAQLSPSRKAIIKDTKKLIPLISDNFTPMESLGYGGLGAAWGLGTYLYSKQELLKVGLPYKSMMESYQFVANHIGISGGNDDITKLVLGNLKNIQTPISQDNSIKIIINKYKKNKLYFTNRRMYLGAAAMAILTENKGNRKATSYSDMDFYSDKEKSAYRPQFTIDSLKLKKNFKYIPKQLVLSFKEVNNIVEIIAIDIKSNTKRIFKTKKLVLATGNIGTARIVMRSFPQIKKLPLLSNPYSYLPGINWAMLGKKLTSRKSSMAQAMMIYDPDGNNDNLLSVSFFTYQSLMLFRLIKESPLNTLDNRIIFQYLQSAFVIAGIHHPDKINKNKYLILEKEDKSFSGDILKAHYNLSSQEREIISNGERKIKKALLKLGVFPIKSIRPGAGSSIHYGGSIPFSDTKELGKQSYEGLLNGTKNVYIADSSGFNFLPAKGVTFSIMANAHRVCNKLINNE